MIPLGVATGASDSVATGASVETTPPSRLHGAPFAGPGCFMGLHGTCVFLY